MHSLTTRLDIALRSLAVMLLASCATQGASSAAGQTQFELRDTAEIRGIFMSFRAPQTVGELLENLKRGVEHDVFLREDFYTDANITQMLGNYPLRWTTNTPSAKYVTIDPQASPLPSSMPNHDCIFGALLSWSTKPGAASTRRAGLQISIELKHTEARCQSLSIDVIRTHFGEPTKIDSIFSPLGPPNPHRDIVPMRTTHPLGNTDIEYVLATTPVSKRIKLEVLGNGVIRRLFLLIQEM